MLRQDAVLSLPMYDWPEFRWATDAWGTGLARHCGIEAGLTRAADHIATWRDANLALSQTCGYPFTHEFSGVLRYVATPSYSAQGCDGPLYCSKVFARPGADLAEPASMRWAVNSLDSMSGWQAARLFRKERWPGVTYGQPLMTGGHRATLAALREGRADICAIDAVCAGLIRHHGLSDLQGLEEIGQSPKVPGLPYVTRGGDIPQLRAGLQAAADDPAFAQARAALLINGITVLPDGAYNRILELEAGL